MRAWTVRRWLGWLTRSAGVGRAAAADIDMYLAAQVEDDTHREVVGPLLAASGSSVVIRVGGLEVASWGDPHVPEMAFSVTKSLVSVVAGLALDDGLLAPDQPVHEVVDIEEFAGAHNSLITWRHLLQQSSQWEGKLWGKPTSADAHSFREGTEMHGTPPGLGWAYNDVRMNLLAYALARLLKRSLGDVLRDRVMVPLGAFAVAVFVERGSGGASVAGPVLEDFLIRVHDGD